MNGTHVCGLRLVVKPDVLWSVEQTPQYRWSLAVLKEFRKKYGRRRCVFVFKNKVTYSIVVFFLGQRKTERFTFYVWTFGPFEDKEHIN